jgi:ubiquitin carboxyl-terminal hydrolase L5
VFLFKWEPSTEHRDFLSDPQPNVFFAKQIINNACATQAILSILLNVQGLDLGQELNGFKEFARDLPFDVRGLALANSDVIRTVHNSFGHPEPFEIEQSKDKSDEGEAFHFIAYVPVNGHLYELDGLQQGPIVLCKLFFISQTK